MGQHESTKRCLNGVCWQSQFSFCLEIFFYSAEANNKTMKGRTNLPNCFEIFTLGSVFLSPREAFQTLRLFFYPVSFECHSTHGIVPSMNYTDSECPSQLGALGETS